MDTSGDREDEGWKVHTRDILRGDQQIDDKQAMSDKQ
jgi:hypothetical protein